VCILEHALPVVLYFCILLLYLFDNAHNIMLCRKVSSVKCVLFCVFFIQTLCKWHIGGVPLHAYFKQTVALDISLI